jgi:heme-degrading monooxygenase HmoA
MPSQAYDQIIATVGESLRQSPGFLSHVAQVSADDVTVTEVWETRDQRELWYATSVMPHLSSDAPPPAVTELHNAIGR